MPDETQGNQIAEEITASAIPTEEQPTEADDSQLPDGVAERTAEEFAKLKQHNAELKSKLAQYEQPKNSVLDDLRPSVPTSPILSKAQVNDIKDDLIDENGYIDATRLQSKIHEAEERAKQAELKAVQAEERMQRFEETAQVKAAHSQFPQLDPNNASFDPRFYDLVKNELIGQMMKGEQNILQAAKKVSELYTPKGEVSKAKADAVAEFKTKAAKRDQASETGKSNSGSVTLRREELIQRTQKGDNNALFDRLNASGY